MRVSKVDQTITSRLGGDSLSVSPCAPLISSLRLFSPVALLGVTRHRHKSAFAVTLTSSRAFDSRRPDNPRPPISVSRFQMHAREFRSIRPTCRQSTFATTVMLVLPQSSSQRINVHFEKQTRKRLIMRGSHFEILPRAVFMSRLLGVVGTFIPL